jgi:formylglycine-generating enzyme
MKLLSFPFAIIVLSTVALSVGCGKSDDTGGDDTGSSVGDADNDGWLTADDCDDTDASLNHDDVDVDGYSTCDGDCDDTDDTVWLCPITYPGGGDMIFIRAGTFDMGCTAAQQTTGECDSNESPVHSVTLTHDFYMGRNEVTQGEYQELAGFNPSNNSSCGLRCPVDNVTWHEVADYANALSVLDGLTECFSCTSGYCTTRNSPYTCDGYRLPTEAEWEYAARAGTDYVYAGSNTLEDVGWYYTNSSYQTHRVAELDPNDWGLYDMSGNVGEWTWDWYDSGYYSSSPSADPEGPASGSYRVLRGGNSYLEAQYLRVSFHIDGTPTSRDYSVGFRLARTVNP